MLGSLQLLMRRPDGDASTSPAAAPLDADADAPLAEGRGSGDRSTSDSGDEAYDRRDVIGKRKSSDRYSSSWTHTSHTSHRS